MSRYRPPMHPDLFPAHDPWEGAPVSPYEHTPPPQPPPPAGHNITVAPQTEVKVAVGVRPHWTLKSVAVAYAFWALLGWFGAHKFYLGRPGMGMLYLLTFGWLLIGWFVDGFTLARQVKIHNARGY